MMGLSCANNEQHGLRYSKDTIAFFIFSLRRTGQWAMIVSAELKNVTAPNKPITVTNPQFSDRLSSEPEFVNLLWSLGINSLPGGPVLQPYLTNLPAMAGRYRARLQYKGWRNRFLGIDSWAPQIFTNPGSGGIDSWAP